MFKTKRSRVVAALLLAGSSLLASCSDGKQLMAPFRPALSSSPTLGHLYALNDGGPAGNNSVSIYDVATGAHVGSIKKGIYDPKAMALDAYGRLYVASDFTNQISVYAPGGHKPRRYLRNLGEFQQNGMATDQYGDVAVVSAGELAAYGPGGALLLDIRETAQNDYSPYSVAFDPGGSLWVKADIYHVNQIVKYALGSIAPITTIATNVGPGPLAVDATGNLYTATTAGDVAVYKPGSSAPSRVIPIGNTVRSIAFDHAGNLFVATWTAISVYNSTTGSLLYTIPKLKLPTSMAFDATNRLYVASEGHNSVAVYAPNTGAPLVTIRSGINQPVSIAIGP